MNYSDTIFVINKSFHEYTLLFPYYDGRKYNVRKLNVKKEDPEQQYQASFLDVSNNRFIKLMPEPDFISTGNSSWYGKYIFVDPSKTSVIVDWIHRLNG